MIDMPVQMVVGVLDAQTCPVRMEELGFKSICLHPRLQLLQTYVGQGLSFQGSWGGPGGFFMSSY